MRWLWLIVPLLLAAATGCKHREAVTPVDIERFDLAAATYSSLDSAARDSFRRTNAPVVDVLRGLMALPDSAGSADSVMLAYAGSRGMEVFGPVVADSLPDLSQAESELGLAFSRLLSMAPDFSQPRLYGVISTYNRAVITTDSAAFIALNHFLGEDYDGYRYFDPYLRRLKRPELIAPLTLQAILASRYPYRGAADATVVSRMVYDGALTLSTAQLLATGDRSSDDIVCSTLGWTPDQWSWAHDNEAAAWNALIERGMIYSTDMNLADRLTRQAPSTPTLHPEAPGRLGTYLGSRIARSWLDRHDGATVLTLLDSAVYNSPSLLVDSRYAPL